ncbi:hypothetical protein CC86DRAFT_385962 [Ophiobolus disseminans]|uniref:Uncharacterized protein n=1 Tax=Ophiobolus disseminans TaxID=1469910 RepID=A0A6A6ZN13_9PLEO|nr:hypothetical protein CC86DRAFT_385962 [Ophiobolus disseminans]
METITNAASSVVTTASNLIYGQPAKDTEATTTTAGNETAGKEPISGQQGKGTVNEPFDQGNAALENPVDTTSKTNTISDSSKDTTSTTGNTSYKQDDFLKLSPTLGKPATTESSTGTSTGTTGETSIPIVPLNPDVATSGTGKTDITTSSATGITDKAGVTDKVWKPTSLDDVEPAGAPGAGPSAPEYTPATPDLSSSTSHKASEPAVKDVAKDTTHTTHTEPSHSSPGPTKESVGGDIDAILESTPKSKHTVDDSQADDPHSKMAGKTVRQTEASHHGESGNSKSLASEKAGASHTSADATSPTGEEKSGKMSQLKDKLKDKLHIGSKDK